MSGGSHLGDFFSNRQEPGQAGLPVMSVTMNDSLVLRDDMERRTESALKPDQHLLVRKGDIAYNMMRMWQGAFGLATSECIVSPAYVVLAPKPGIDSRFAYHWFKSARMIHLFWAYSHGLTEDRLRLYFDAFAEIPAVPPDLEQQRQIVVALDVWDQAIDQTERMIAAKRLRKRAISQELFSKLPKRPLLEAADVWFSGIDKKSSANETSVLLCGLPLPIPKSKVIPCVSMMSYSRRTPRLRRKSPSPRLLQKISRALFAAIILPSPDRIAA